jgi:hypothetical protein
MSAGGGRSGKGGSGLFKIARDDIGRLLRLEKFVKRSAKLRVILIKPFFKFFFHFGRNVIHSASQHSGELGRRSAYFRNVLNPYSRLLKMLTGGSLPPSVTGTLPFAAWETKARAWRLRCGGGARSRLWRNGANRLRDRDLDCAVRPQCAADLWRQCGRRCGAVFC